MNRIVLMVEGMSCQHCVKAVSDAVNALSAVELVSVDLNTKTVTVDCDNTRRGDVIAAIEEQGYEVLS